MAVNRMHRKIGRAQERATPLTKTLLNQLLASCDNSVMGIRNQVLLTLRYETMHRWSELCAFNFEEICQAPNPQPAIRINFSKADQLGIGKILPISQEFFDLLEE